MATKKDVADLKFSLKMVLSSIEDLHTDLLHVKDSVIKALQYENSKLKSRLRKLEIDFMGTSNHSRRNNIIINGINPDISNKDLEPLAIKILH